MSPPLSTLPFRIIVLADGKASRWTSPVLKHLAEVRGEILLYRTIRQLRERGATDIWITSHESSYKVPGVTRYAPPDNLVQVDQFYACREIWQFHRNVVFLYGDVYFSDAAMDTILNHTIVDFAYYQRTKGSKVTGKPWKEGFAMRVQDPEILLSACSYLRNEILSGRQQDCHHQLQGYLEGHGSGDYFETVLGPHGVEIDDETDDFDVPADIETWTKYTTMGSQPGNEPEGGFSMALSSSLERRELGSKFWEELSRKMICDPLIFDLGSHHLEEAEQLVPHLIRPSWHGFEPNVDCYEYAVKHVASRLMKDHDCLIRVSNVAVGRNRGEADLYLSSKKNGDPWTPSSSTRKPKNALVFFPWMAFEKSVKVSVVTLDEYAHENGWGSNPVELVKMDIQGAEIDAVIGGQRTLSRTKFLVVEVVEGEEYEGQVGLRELIAALPGRWELVERMVSDVLLVNVTRNSG
jgi:FkbM family methyltransferase